MLILIGGCSVGCWLFLCTERAVGSRLGCNETQRMTLPDVQRVAENGPESRPRAYAPLSGHRTLTPAPEALADVSSYPRNVISSIF